jgi:hypothetical protein
LQGETTIPDPECLAAADGIAKGRMFILTGREVFRRVDT